MPPKTGAAQLFVDADFSGATVVLHEGDYNINKLAVRDPAGNNTVSSLLIAEGYIVAVYTLEDLQGDSTIFTTDTAYVGDAFNDTISSIRVTRPGRAEAAADGGEGGHRLGVAVDFEV